MAGRVLRGVHDHARLLTIDWRALRATLVRLRAESAYRTNISGFSRATGLNRITVRRVENIDGAPEYEPDIATMASWLSAVGWTRGVGMFIAEHETTPQASLLTPREREQVRRLVNALVRAIDLM